MEETLGYFPTNYKGPICGLNYIITYDCVYFPEIQENSSLEMVIEIVKVNGIV